MKTQVLAMRAAGAKRLDSIVGNMMRTRRLHARLAYVVRVDDRASISYAAAPARNVRRGVVSPEVLMRSLSSQCQASRIKKSSAFGERHQRENSSAGYACRGREALGQYGGEHDAHKTTACTLSLRGAR